MRQISIAQAKAFDQQAQEKFGVPSIVLMENAGRSVAEEALKMLRGKKKVAVVCGVGNNGGDGLVAARHLLNANCKVSLYLVGKKNKIKADPSVNLKIVKKMGQKVVWVRSLADLKDINRTDLIIEGLFGIGLASKVRDPYDGIIAFLNKNQKPILSIDVPSGLDADTGQVLGLAVKAKKTITFIALKKGFFKELGPQCCGTIIVKDIGIAQPN